MNFYYDPLDRACKSRTGAVPRASELTLQVYRNAGGEENFSAEVCSLILWRDGEGAAAFPMQKTARGWTASLKLHRTGLYFYLFDLGERGLGCGKLRRAELSETPSPWQLTVYDERYTTPEWFKGSVMYQIFPDRFYKAGDRPIAPYKILRDDWGGQPNYRPNQFGKVLNNDFFGGNLNGIREKLDYLASLHVSVVYLNPIFEAYSNHRYDTGDYRKIDELLGTEEDLRALVEDAAKRGIRIILDGVFNHTGDDSRYFNKYGRYDDVGAFQSRGSKYADWYNFHSFPDSYDSWWGIETLPAVNERSPSYQNFICGEDGVLKQWLRCGIGGYRLDVADELPDFFLRMIRESVKSENAEAVIIGEVWEDASNKIAYDERRQYLQGFELDSVMNYPLKDAVLDFVRTGNTSMLRETIAMLLDNYPKPTVDCLMNILGTHDTPRVLTVLGGKVCADKDEMAQTFMSEDECADAAEKLKFAALLQYTLPGVPCVYYGDEIGMQGYADPFCRGCFEWERTESTLHDFYLRLGEIRGELLKDVFADGDYREVFADASCLVFERKKGDAAAYVVVNHSPSEYVLHFSGGYRELLSGTDFCDKAEIKGAFCGIFVKKQ